MVDIVDKALRMGEGHQLKRLENVAKAVNALEDEISALSDEELKGQTAKFKQRLDNGAKLDDLMPEAFATVREVSKRTLGQRHFDVQLMGGAALHWGNIAEMKTGEGKTLVATLPSYLNALEGKGVHVVTVNDYLASYQSELMGRIYRFLGMSVGCIITDQQPPERRKQYNADITYGTNNEFGFDYLRDNMAWEKSELVQRGHHYAIVDEVDSILIDEARTPLIISGPAEGDVTHWYREFAKLVLKLTRDVDYEIDEKKKTAGILDPGIAKIEDYLGIDNLYEPSNTALIGYLNNALKAKELFLLDRDYVVTNGEVLIVDEHTGRVLPGRRYSEGLHQAIEAKENVEVKAENQTFATITLQNYFRMYDKLAGMTGTAETEAAEFMGTYKLGVLPIPSNRPVIRKDKDDLIFRTKKEKLTAIVRDVAERHAKGQPVLLGTASVESSEILSSLLDVARIPHQVLNAKQNAKEAAVVAVAGRKGAVTVATNMAGRGTDIMLGGNVEFLADAKLKAEGYSPDDTPEEYEKRWPGVLAEVKEQVKDEHEEVKNLGGLYVLGTERHESRRIDNQLRGRSGRQGDPGESRFYLSLEDDLMRLFNTQLVARVMAKGLPEGEPIESKYVSNGVRTAQKTVEARNFEMRKNVLKYDDVMNKQRTVIYAERQMVLKGEDIHEDILKFISDTVESYVRGAMNGSDKPKNWDLDGLKDALNSVMPVLLDWDQVRETIINLKGEKAVSALRDLIVDSVVKVYSLIEDRLGADPLRQIERRVVLSVLDRKWREHLYEMDYLKDGIGLRGMGQRDPLVEYQREGYQMYNSMIEAIKEESIQLLFHIDINQIASTEDISSDDELDEDVAQASSEVDAEDQAAGIVGPAPLSHAEGDVPLSMRPKNEEWKTPWSDGRTFPGTNKNEECPCGSGRKYKLCHGQNESGNEAE
ncbi:preprotein translocase subunit SecA [Gardnerella swidsinskii]|uniref:preprotein translocase subunit SecA n=1 Tax=Gardnerella TaxID=2701 RepID=UPI000E6795B3|nr:preprotein translocase subunit SecA [Gardnerella swidsinskii]MDK7093405.1 preprotein translocase subunit SecA [Gardnerella swidsinskii]RIY29858.1 preprotein translocase subunit SecA [Bifidobacteriaceae bacterium NR016]